MLTDNRYILFSDDTDFSESEGLSSAQTNKRDSNLRSPTSATSETEEESRDEPRVLRIETKQAPKPSQPEVVLSDGKLTIICDTPSLSLSISLSLVCEVSYKFIIHFVSLFLYKVILNESDGQLVSVHRSSVIMFPSCRGLDGAFLIKIKTE